MATDLEEMMARFKRLENYAQDARALLVEVADTFGSFAGDCSNDEQAQEELELYARAQDFLTTPVAGILDKYDMAEILGQLSRVPF